jgi:hypothetical protein
MYTAGQHKLTGPLRAELDAFLEEHGSRWHVVGPCLDAGWYAWPRADVLGPRVLAASLAELTIKLKEASRPGDSQATQATRCRR